MNARILNLLPDEPAALSRLWLNATDAARVCGVTVRQLTYWTDKGIIPSSSENGRSYNVAALNKVIAIKKLMLTGLTLEKAASAVSDAEVEAFANSAMADDSRGAYIDGLIGALEDWRHNLPAYIAMANLRRTADALSAVGLERLLGRGGLGVEEVTAHLNAAAFTLEHLLDDLRTPAPVDSPVSAPAELANAGSAGS